MIPRPIVMIWVVLFLLSGFSASAGDDATATPDSDPFVELEGLRGNIDFWTLVFSEWTHSSISIKINCRSFSSAYSCAVLVTS